MAHLDRPQRTALFSATLLVAAIAALLMPAIAAMAVVAVLAVAVVTIRVVAVERQQPLPLGGRLLLLGTAAVLGTRLVLWFGPVGAVIALVVIVLVLVLAGADIG